MKRIFAMLLALLLVCSLVACGEKEDEDDQDIDLTVTNDGQYHDVGGAYNDRFAYKIINGNQVAITGFVSDYTPHDVVIPTTIEECPVVEIADSAFYHCSQLRSITIPSAVKSIGKMAFSGCTQLAEVKYEGNVSNIALIGDLAFAYCKSLATITLPNTVTTLGMGAFLECEALATINVPAVVRGDGGVVVSGVTTLPDMVFMGCESLATVTGGEGIEVIGDYAFRGCAKLTSMTLPASLTKIGDYGFSGCTSFAVPTLGDGVTVGEFAFE